MGKFLAAFIVVCAVGAGAAIYYLNEYAYYEEVTLHPGLDVVLLPQNSDASVVIDYADFEAIDASSSPIRYRACFTTALTRDELAQSYTVLQQQKPRIAPGWFDCFDAQAIGAELEAGTATAFMSVKNIEYGVDRIVAVTDQGRGYVWHELNNCGKKAYDGTVVGETCPDLPEVSQ
ncbi:DUF6446 family protein [Parasedimentitalea psychrophila]|uniref:DUF6446 family protein n=1 Tax=Parasedimentitalea psychrophila TaxID=2997337 RepID=A0A9Y2P1S2_9RHOB|nr:DUF6446 family protein [Parasedimentitalea psychrophila]WIY25891.1 DUF6446 family protein [Parasedimentitalea psychrophila]